MAAHELAARGSPPMGITEAVARFSRLRGVTALAAEVRIAHIWLWIASMPGSLMLAVLSLAACRHIVGWGGKPLHATRSFSSAKKRFAPSAP